MKYFIDTEFHEFKKKPFIGKPINTIELISIGIVAEDGREYYAISKDFDLKAAWNNEWLRNNVIQHLIIGYIGVPKRMDFASIDNFELFKKAIRIHGKTNKQIAQEIKDFVYGRFDVEIPDPKTGKKIKMHSFKRDWDALHGKKTTYEFYGYYSDYDWVIFCWLFGRMIDLPKGFLMYCIDLKQTLDEKNILQLKDYEHLGKNAPKIKEHIDYPKQTNEHNALADAKWNFELYKFLQTI